MNDLGEGLSLLSEDPKAPFILDVKINMEANAYPKLAFGRQFGEMEPYVKPIDMEST